MKLIGSTKIFLYIPSYILIIATFYQVRFHQYINISECSGQT